MCHRRNNKYLCFVSQKRKKLAFHFILVQWVGYNREY